MNAFLFTVAVVASVALLFRALLRMLSARRTYQQDWDNDTRTVVRTEHPVKNARKMKMGVRPGSDTQRAWDGYAIDPYVNHAREADERYRQEMQYVHPVWPLVAVPVDNAPTMEHVADNERKDDVTGTVEFNGFGGDITPDDNLTRGFAGGGGGYDWGGNDVVSGSGESSVGDSGSCGDSGSGDSGGGSCE